MINATNTSTAPSSNPTRMSVVVRTPATSREPAQSERTGGSSEVRDVRHRHHHHHHADRGRSRDSAEASSEAFLTLKVKIQQTVSSLMDKGAGAPAAVEPGAESPAPASGGALKISAKFEMSGPEGSLEASMKIRLDSGSADAASGFAAVMQSFAETLYAALQTLYGAAPASPPAGAVTGPPAGAPTALPAPSPPADTPASPAAAAPPPAVTTPLVADAPAAADSTAVLPTAPTPIASAVTPSVAGSDAGNAARSLTIKLRLTYDAFGSSLGPLVNQLAQPGVGNDRPEVSPLLGDLAERFAQMMSLASGGGAGAPSLNTFLTALSRSFFGVGGTEAPVSALPAPAANAPADPAPATTAAPPAQSATQHFTAMAEYKQVLSFGAAPVTLRSSLAYGFA